MQNATAERVWLCVLAGHLRVGRAVAETVNEETDEPFRRL